MLMREDLKLVRTRHIPNERLELKKDEVLYLDDEILVTKWNVINPKDDFSKGVSVYHLNRGYKLSKLYDMNGNFVHWYCDIIKAHINGNEYEFEDLLLDVIVMPDGHSYKVMDADEFAQAIEEKMISVETACEALRSFNDLVTAIEEKRFFTLTKKVEELC